MQNRRMLSQPLWGILGVCLAYLAIQFLYAPFAIFSDDDFWLAYHTFQFHDALPYRDFAPYKTVLGYYLLLIPMSLYSGVVLPLIKTKLFVAIINASLLFFSARWLTKYFSTEGVLTGLLLAVSAHLFLTYGTEIRVDMFAYWLCLIAVLAIFSKRFSFAGGFLGIAFLVSQKTLMNIIAIDAALLAMSLITVFSTRRFFDFAFACKSLLRMNFVMLLPIFFYIAIWSYYSSFATVMRSMFYEAYLISAIESYTHFRFSYWQMNLNDNAFFFLLFPLAWISLFIKSENDTEFFNRRFLVFYGTFLTLSVISYKQPFSYNMVVLTPVYFLLYAAFFSWIFAGYRSTTVSFLLLSKKACLLLIGIYLSALLTTICLFKLPVIYSVIGLIPLFLTRYLFGLPRTNGQAKSLSITIVLLVTLFTGVIYPLTRFAGSLNQMDGRYQKYMMNLANTLLQDGGDYLAGIALFYNRDQPIAGLKHISLSVLEYLYEPTDERRKTMQLDSLYFSPTTPEKIIQSLATAHVKFFVNNNRFIQLPKKIKDALFSEYQHFWGSIYLYAPTFHPNDTRVMIKFQGKYQLESQTPVALDGKSLNPSSFIQLTAGSHEANAKQNFRLRFIPQGVPHPLNPDYHMDQWQRMLF